MDDNGGDGQSVCLGGGRGGGGRKERGGRWRGQPCGGREGLSKSSLFPLAGQEANDSP